jgi:hypothetical protein
MFNANRPDERDLPTTGQLIRSTLIAIGVAIVLLVTIVLPSEYAIDPTGIGRALGLTPMGEIKQQLAGEAHSDEMAARAPVEAAPESAPAVVAEAQPVETPAEPAPAAAAAAAAAGKTDEASFTLKPSEGTEYKLTMLEGAKVAFTWSVEGGVVNYDLHGTARTGAETSYRKGREVQTDTGELVAAFDGAHGWFWRNRGKQDVTVTLRVSGDYGELKRLK